ncbi:MAG: hypothetical protein K0U66_07430 [Gammaproteobacteria bacterium]|nr:hypothetical protein [Gammaproteobacteria bacterium]
MTQPTQKQLDELQRADDAFGWEIEARKRKEQQDEYLAKYHPELLRSARQSEARSALASIQQLTDDPISRAV